MTPEADDRIPHGLDLSGFLLTQISQDEGLAAKSDPNQHQGGVPWWKAPIPRRWHRCWPQTSGWVGSTFVERCACGGMRRDQVGSWFWRNSARRDRRR